MYTSGLTIQEFFQNYYLPSSTVLEVCVRRFAPVETRADHHTKA